MSQQRLERYFSRHQKPSRQGKLSLLDLPSAVRHRIDILAGLVRFCPIDLNREGSRAELHLSHNDGACFYRHRKFHGRFYGCNTGETVVHCGCSKLPYSLLYVSKAISKEVVHTLYSGNQFSISAHGKGGLEPLQRLRPGALAALRSLSIRLNNCSCVYGHSSFPGRDISPCHRLCKGYGIHDKAIGSEARQDKALLRAWCDLAQTLSRSITPGVLKFSLACDVKDLHTANQIIAPLKQFSSLETTSIRLGEKPNHELYELARSRAVRLIGQLDSNSSYSYSYHLPEEVLEQILSYTDLIASYDLEWLPGHGLVPFDCCKTCVATLDSCSCAFYHAAFSSTCTCWRLPISLFLTSRVVRRIATAAFYSKNRFVPPPDQLDWRRIYMKTGKFHSPLTRFLERLPPAGLIHLRRIALIFPDLDPEAFLLDKRKTTEWLRAIEVLPNLDLSRLTLALYIDSAPYMSDVWPTPAQRQKRFLRVLQLLAPVAKIRKFFVFVDHETEQFEGLLEKSIIGRDYDSIANGKVEERLTLWYDGFSRDRPVEGSDDFCELSDTYFQYFLRTTWRVRQQRYDAYGVLQE